jgi:RimJ/RimL family protein N-acetyltransferase
VRELTFVDLPAVRQLLSGDLLSAPLEMEALAEADVADWLRWTVDGYAQLARLHQPPYGERAVVHRADGRLVGLVGYVPLLAPFAQLSAFGAVAYPASFTPEVGLYWAILRAQRGQGYAVEAARALVSYAFEQLTLARLVATTANDNAPSLGVMRRLGMRIERNPYPEPAWFQAVGILER